MRHPRALAAALALVLVGAAVACDPAPPPPPPPTPCAATAMTTHRDVRYADVPAGVDPRLLSLDVYQPTVPASCRPAPVMVWVHGGGWRTGDKSNNLFAKLVLMASEGYVLVSVNYRLSPAVVYPTHNEDVAAAVAWVHDNIAGYGGDPASISLMGHSAGAGIVSSVGTDESYLQAEGLDLDDLSCMISVDTEAYDVAEQAATSAIYRQAFGTDPAVWADASPLTHVEPGKGIPRAMVITRGTPSRIALSIEFGQALAAAGVPVRLLGANPLSHEGVNDAIGAPGDTIVTPHLRQFLTGC